MKKIIILVSISLFFVGCASNSSSVNRTKNIVVTTHAKEVLADNTSEEKVICKQVKRTGSNRITTVCRSQSEIREIREATQLQLRKSLGANSSRPGN